MASHDTNIYVCVCVWVTLHGKINHLAHKIVFFVKVTITNYDFWTTDPANLKSLAPVGSEICAKMYPDRPY